MNLFKYSKLIFFEKGVNSPQTYISTKQPLFSFLSLPDFKTSRFFKEELRDIYEKRFYKGDLCASLLIDGQIVNISWLAKNNLIIDEIQRKYDIPENEIMIYDVVTKESERGKGFYPLMLELIVQWAMSAGIKTVSIFSETHNRASIKGITKAGFCKKKNIAFLKIAGLKFYFN